MAGTNRACDFTYLNLHLKDRRVYTWLRRDFPTTRGVGWIGRFLGAGHRCESRGACLPFDLEWFQRLRSQHRRRGGPATSVKKKHAPSWVLLAANDILRITVTESRLFH